MTHIEPILDLIQTLSAPSDSNDAIRSEKFKELDRWIRTQLKNGSDEILFSVARELPQDQQSFYFGCLKSNIDYRPIMGGEAFVFGIPLFFATKAPYDLISKHESNIQEECLQQMTDSGIFHPSCLVSSLGHLSDLTPLHPIKPSVLYSMSSYLCLSEKLHDEYLPENDHDLPEIDAVTKGFRLLHDQDRCLLLGSAYWFFEKTDFGLVPPGSEEFDRNAASASKNIGRTISRTIGIPCHVHGLMPFSMAVNDIMTGHFGD